jgi:hypothetical protein
MKDDKKAKTAGHLFAHHADDHLSHADDDDSTTTTTNNGDFEDESEGLSTSMGKAETKETKEEKRETDRLEGASTHAGYLPPLGPNGQGTPTKWRNRALAIFGRAVGVGDARYRVLSHEKRFAQSMCRVRRAVLKAKK